MDSLNSPADSRKDPYPELLADDASDAVSFDVRPHQHISVELPVSTLITPRSLFDGFTPPLPPVEEQEAVAALMVCVETQGTAAKKEFIEFELDRFTFYIHHRLYPYEMRPLHHLATKIGIDKFYFDGILSVGSVKHYVNRVEVVALPIGNYGPDHHSTNDQIWVRSTLNRNKEIYYLLKKPAAEYARFYEPFLWIADLGKHVVDFCVWHVERKREVTLNSFKESFIRWLDKTHAREPAFLEWRRQHPSDDYRTSVVANIDFIWKEINGGGRAGKAANHRFFKETLHFTQYKPNVPLGVDMIEEGKGGKKEQQPPTTVTPYIKECFGHMIIGKLLRLAGEDTPLNTLPPPAKLAQHEMPQVSAGVPCGRGYRAVQARPQFLSKEMVDKIKVGDTISTPRDGEEDTDTKWRTAASKDSMEDHRWFALVQKVHVSRNGERSFDVSWFYRPAETPCCEMKYPWPNELFLSDHCTCMEGSHSRVKGSEVLATHTIDWFGNPNTSPSVGEFFVRQTYIIEKRRFQTLDESHKKCFHGLPPLKFKVGDAVLADLSSTDEVTEAFSPTRSLSEVYEVVKIFRQEETRFVRLRQLLRRSKIDPLAPNAAPNELVYADSGKLFVVKPDKVEGKCHMRFFRPNTPIPSPYNRGGTGNLFFITHKLEEQDGELKCLPWEGEYPSSFRQGFDPSCSYPKLKGLDLFCGGGNFGRGLEEGGAIEMRWANDIWEKAIHTYMANTDTKTTHAFLGSVDDLLRQAIEGKYASNVPRPGEVDFISGGSPCPGFSLLTVDKTTLHQIKNQSLVASFASFVDFYRPKYGILENVESIVQARHNRKEDVLSQLFCALVGLGYQAQLILGDAWSHGAPQCRKRVFLYFAAAGLRMPEPPMLSHSHFPGVKSRNLGEMCNGEPFVKRESPATAFKYVSASEATADLPNIMDAKPDSCVAFPDHRLAYGCTSLMRMQTAVIPHRPYGLRFATAWAEGRGVMTRGDRELFPAAGKSRSSVVAQGWGRVNPRNTFHTVTTRCNPTDARVGAGLHWNQDRPLTLQEMRRAQGYLDHEVILGSPYDQWKVVGNSVARQMALALGLQFREAWDSDETSTANVDSDTATDSSRTARASSRKRPRSLAAEIHSSKIRRLQSTSTPPGSRRSSRNASPLAPAEPRRSLTPSAGVGPLSPYEEAESEEPEQEPEYLGQIRGRGTSMTVVHL
ncbi:hypothetical protein B0T19DRAFT_451814 [Cercophora scortea]|uniref:DNA (cytosine-5-)-methyltransferase n=1 Tax=Cercophora scortea TaxID=314031 RepID=A0AAE0I3Q3_9PEZI|nr:hypothetical protein B0T19DRAFT_451814 [Cercophora scortea]